MELTPARPSLGGKQQWFRRKVTEVSSMGCPLDTLNYVDSPEYGVKC